MVKGTLVRNNCIRANEQNEVTKGFINKDGNFVAFDTSGSSDSTIYQKNQVIGKANMMKVSDCLSYGQTYAKAQNDDTYYLGFASQGSHKTTDKIICLYSDTDLSSGFNTGDCAGQTLDGYKTGAGGTVGGANQETALYKFDTSEDPKDTKKWYDFIYNKNVWIGLGVTVGIIFFIIFIAIIAKRSKTKSTTTVVPDNTNTTTTDT